MQVFIPDNNPETPFNTERRKGRKRKDGTFDEQAVFMAGTIQSISQKNARMWQVIALVSLVSFFVSLGICAYAVRLPKTVPVIVTVDGDGVTNYVGRVDRSYWGRNSIPENAKTYVIKRLIANMFTRVIDTRAQQSYVDECGAICQGQALNLLDTFFLENNPFSMMGVRTQTVNLEEPMRETDRTYVIYFNVLTYERGVLMDSRRYSALVTLDFFDGVPETNPLGIYVTTFDIKTVR